MIGSRITTTSFPEMPSIPTGWQCPVCKRVYSPSTSMCTNTHQPISFTTYGTGLNVAIDPKDGTIKPKKKGKK